jgi:hypothetical protein
VKRGHEIAIWLLIVCALIGAVNGTLAFIDRVFPEGSGAESIPPNRMVICGRVGKYRLYCGVSDDFVGPIPDPVSQWNRWPKETK